MQSILFRFGLSWITIATTGGNLLGFTLADPAPLNGPVGSTVTIEGTGFDPEATYLVTLGDLEATVDSVSEEAIEITLPNDAESGYFRITDGLQASETGRAFLVTKEITVTFADDLGMDVSGYDMGTFYSTAKPGEGAGFVLEIDTANHSLVMADADEASGSPLYGIGRTDSDSLVLGAESTVEAFALMGELFYSPDRIELGQRIDFLRSQSTFTDAASAVQSHLAAGTNWLNSNAVDAALEAMLTEFYATYVDEEDPQRPTSEQTSTFGDFSEGFFGLRIVRDLENSGWELLDRLRPLEDIQIPPPGPGPRGTPVQKIRMLTRSLRTTWETADSLVGLFKANPLDWSANLYELDIDDPLLDTAQEVDNLTESYWNHAYDRVKDEPLDKLLIPATLVSSNIDIEGKLTGLIQDQAIPKFIGLFGKTPKSLELKKDITIPNDRPGIYMIRSFSGAAFPEQYNLIDSLPGGSAEHYRMIALNIAMAVNDGIGILVGQNNTISQSEWAKFIVGLERSILKKVVQQAEEGTLNSEFILGVYWETRKATRAWLVTQAKNGLVKLATDGKKGRFGRIVKSLKSASNITGRVAASFKILERIAALTNAPRFIAANLDNARIAFALEDVLVVVGNPWAPSIESFEPTEGYWDSTVTLYGDRFSTVPEENVVTFGRSFTSTDGVGALTRAKVLSATKDTLIVKVPEDSATGIITVAVDGQGVGTTDPNYDPYYEFTVIPDPVIEGTTPVSPEGGQAVRIIGTNFPTEPGFDFKLRFSEATFDSIPVVKSDTEMYVFAPAFYGEQALTMKMLDRDIGALPIEILEPPTPPEGLVMQVNTTADSPEGYVEDGKLSLREALMLANATLSVGDLDEEEANFVFNAQLGPESKNTINYSLGDPVLVSGPLPSITNYDEINNLRIDGLTVDGQPFVLDGTQGAFLNILRIYHSSQDGLLLKNGASGNRGQIIIESPVRHGLHLEGSASNNNFGVSVKDPQGNGIHLSGTGVFGNSIQIGLHVGIDGGDLGDWGVVIEDGASFNRIGGDSSTQTAITGFKEGGVWIQGGTSGGNAIGHDFFSSDVYFLPIHGNDGPGLVAEGSGTRLTKLNVRDNQGHGIEFRPGSIYSSLSSSRIGYHSDTGEVEANQGSGIYVAPGSGHLILGSLTDGREAFANSIGGNRDHGILIEGAQENIRINATTIGTVYYLNQNTVAMRNGEHGIALMDGASDVRIGDGSSVYGTHITNHTNGAAIYLDGANTRNNLIRGATIGVTDALAKINLGSEIGGNAIGIKITGGAYGNQIGLPGERIALDFPLEGFLVPWNDLYHNDIGILIESGGDPSQSIPPDPEIPYIPQGANVVVNNNIGDETRGNTVGVKLSGAAFSNRIGGSGATDGNRIYQSAETGILIDGLVANRPERANLIVGNDILGTGLDLEDIPDPRDGNLNGVGILIKNGADGQIIGGELPGQGNRIRSGVIGIGIENSHDNFVLGNDIGGIKASGLPTSTFFQNRQAGVFLFDSDGNQIGPGNLIAGNGLPDGPPLGGVYIKDGIGNLVVGNTIGRPANAKGGLRQNSPAGITLDNTLENQIGVQSPDGINEIGSNLGPGVHVFGAGSRGNQIENNQIGTNLASEDIPNSTFGILIEDGVTDSLIRSNTIFNNDDDGIRIEGAGTNRNTISLNSITGHAPNQGISLTLTGNAEIQPPTMETADGFTIDGSVPTGTPNGSIVEFFSDPGTEGETPIGFAIVVDEGFSFSAALAPFLQLTATLTDTNGNTSEFSPVFNIFPFDEGSTLDVRRTAGEPEELSAPANSSPVPVMPIALTAPEEFSVSVESLTFTPTGSIDESTDLLGVAVYRDLDQDGMITSQDALVSEVTPITIDDGEVLIATDASIREGERDELILAAFIKDSAGVGSTLQFDLESALMVESKTHFSGTPISAAGVFPVVGDTVTLTEPVDAYDEWRKDAFSPEDAADDEISGRNADPDEDGIPNLLEFALGTLPGSPDLWNDALISVADSHYIFQFPVAESLLGLETIAEATNDLVTWNSGEGVADIVGSIEDGSGGFLLVVTVPIPANEATLVFARLIFEP